MSKKPNRKTRKRPQVPRDLGSEEDWLYEPRPRFYEQARQLEEKRRGVVRQLWVAQRKIRRWIFLRDIASSRARIGTENPPNEARRVDTYRLFKIALLSGAFQEGGRSWVHWWNPEFPFQRLTIEDAQRFVADHQGDLAGLTEQCFQWCVLPRHLARGWCEAEGWELPPWLREPGPADLPPPPRRRKPTTAAVKEWIRIRVADWPDELPPPAEDVDWAAARREFGDGLRRDDFRPIRENGVPPEWKTQGRRKPWGQLKKGCSGKSAKNSAKPRRQK
jgi:hypothetical protein